MLLRGYVLTIVSTLNVQLWGVSARSNDGFHLPHDEIGRGDSSMRTVTADHSKSGEYYYTNCSTGLIISVRIKSIAQDHNRIRAFKDSNSNRRS